MKIAVCVSGLPRSGVPDRNIKINIDRLKNNFPTADFYFASWDGQQDVLNKLLPGENVQYFQDDYNTYHPYIDTPTSIVSTGKYHKMVQQAKSNITFRNLSYHQHKQIIIHSLLCNTLSEEYDVIVRSRFDTVTYSKASFSEYILDAHTHKRAIGFATLRHDWNTFNIAREIPIDSEYQYHFLFDQLIIHNRAILNSNKVLELYNKKLLLPAEFGWWQVLSINNNHRNISGWANPDKAVESRFL